MPASLTHPNPRTNADTAHRPVHATTRSSQRNQRMRDIQRATASGTGRIGVLMVVTQDLGYGNVAVEIQVITEVVDDEENR
jgi:hypothetical protein